MLCFSPGETGCVRTLGCGSFNAFKRGQVGAGPDEYIEAKAEFIEAELGDSLGNE